jgi:hypothetical protein
MARKRKKESSEEPQQVVVPVIYEARLGTNGAVIRIMPTITQAEAIGVRQRDGNVVICGPNKTANSVMAREIENAAHGHWKRCKPHINAGPNALPHYQPDPRGQTLGHTFYETDTKHPL